MLCHRLKLVSERSSSFFSWALWAATMRST